MAAYPSFRQPQTTQQPTGGQSPPLFQQPGQAPTAPPSGAKTGGGMTMSGGFFGAKPVYSSVPAASGTAPMVEFGAPRATVSSAATPPPAPAPNPNNMSGPGALEQLYASKGSAYGQPTAVSSFYQNTALPAYGQPGMYEQWAQSTLSGSNPTLERIKQQGMDAIDQRMAARGAYNSGGAATALGNYGAAMDAEMFKYMNDVARGGQDSTMARVGAGMGAAGGASGSALDYLNAQFGQAGAAQGAQQGCLGQMFGNQLAMDQLAAGLYGNFYGLGSQLSGQSMSDYWNMLGNASQQEAAGAQSRNNALMTGFGVL